MAEPVDLDRLPQATVVPPKRGRISLIWVIPILAALVAIGIAVQRIRSEGPTITIVFTAAEGIEAGKTFIKFKDVVIGRVTAVNLTPDYSKVEVTAKITKRAAGLMVQDARFWVVRPSISLSGISGLNTLLSGNYVGFEPGTLDISEDTFTGLDVAPLIAAAWRRRLKLMILVLGLPLTPSQQEVCEAGLEAAGRRLIELEERVVLDPQQVAGLVEDSDRVVFAVSPAERVDLGWE